MTLSIPRPLLMTPRDRSTIDPPPPVAVERAGLLWTAGAAVGFVGGLSSIVVALVLRSSILARVVADGGDPRLAGPTAVRGVLLVGVVQVAVAGIGYLVAPLLGEGRGWGRVVLTLVAVVEVGALLAGATANNHPGLTLLSAGGTLLVLLALLYAFQPRASAWFRTLRRARTRSA